MMLLASLCHWGMLRHFVQLLGDAPSLLSVAGGCSLTSFSCWGCSLLHFIAGGMLPCFAQSLGGCSLTLLSHWGDTPSLRSVTRGTLPHFVQSLGGPSITSLSRFPFNGFIKLLQNLHSRGSMKQHFFIWEPRCGYLHKVKRANGAINMHWKGSNESLPNIDPPYGKMVSYPLIKEGQWSHKYTFLRDNRAINMHSRGPTKNGLAPPH